jgi:hypothetical protein
MSVRGSRKGFLEPYQRTVSATSTRGDKRDIDIEYCADLPTSAQSILGGLIFDPEIVNPDRLRDRGGREMNFWLEHGNHECTFHTPRKMYFSHLPLSETSTATVLPDGRDIRIRRAEAHGAGAIQGFIRRLAPRAHYHRFWTRVRESPVLVIVVQADGRRAVTLLFA